jgi:hypothetical protein
MAATTSSSVFVKAARMSDVRQPLRDRRSNIDPPMFHESAANYFLAGI